MCAGGKGEGKGEGGEEDGNFLVSCFRGGRLTTGMPSAVFYGGRLVEHTHCSTQARFEEDTERETDTRTEADIQAVRRQRHRQTHRQN